MPGSGPLIVVAIPPSPMAAARGRCYVDQADGWIHLPIPRDEAAAIAELGIVTIEITIRVVDRGGEAS